MSSAAVRSLLVASAWALASAPGAAQTPTSDSVYRRLLDFPSLVRGGTVTPHWMADGHSFWYLDGAPADAVAWKVDPSTGRVDSLIDVARLRRGLEPLLGHAPPYAGLPFATFQLVDGEKAVTFEVEGRRFRAELASYAIRELPHAGAEPAGRIPGANGSEAPAPDGRLTAFIRGGKVWLRAAADGRDVPLTDEGTAEAGWLGSGAVGSPALAWSPSGALLTALRGDARGVHRTIVAHWLDQDAEDVTRTVYALTGGPVEQLALCVLGVLDRSRRCFDTGPEPDQRLVPLAWRPDGSEFLFFRLDRLMKRLELRAGDAETGATRIVVADSQPTFIEGLAFAPATMAWPLADNRRVIWRSERDGWSHLYLYDLDGTLLGRLTGGDFPVERVVGVDEKNGWVYFLARGGKRPYDLNLHRVDLAGRRLTRLTESTGEHDVVLSPDKGWFLDTHSAPDRPPATELRRANGSLVRTLASADISELTALGWQPPEEFTVKAADGRTDLYGALYRPAGFDPSRRYPVIDLQYMGNFRTSAPHRFAGNWPGDEAHALARLGFAVFVVDGRGTTGRGKAFQDVAYHSLGQFEVADHVAALRQLAAVRPWMDTSRVGITGYSWGGYYTLRALLAEPGVFKVGVAGAPVVDLRAHPAPIEPYMGTPQTNPEGYAKASTVAIADRLRGKLLLVIGTSDTNVTFTHSMRLADAFIRAGKHFDLIVMPGEDHAMSPRGRGYYVEARARYFLEHLKAGAGEP